MKELQNLRAHKSGLDFVKLGKIAYGNDPSYYRKVYDIIFDYARHIAQNGRNICMVMEVADYFRWPVHLMPQDITDKFSSDEWAVSVAIGSKERYLKDRSKVLIEIVGDEYFKKNPNGVPLWD